MKSKNTILALSILLITVSCLWSENNDFQTAAAQSKIKPVTNVDAGSDDAACFDTKMAKWFSAFNDYQEQGMDMIEADKKANEDAAREYRNCSLNRRIAADSESLEPVSKR